MSEEFDEGAQPPIPEGINPEFVINLKGKQYLVWAGVLDLAHQRGLVSLTTRVLQIPTSGNGQLAVVSARAVFKDEREFEDVGDCGPGSTTPQLATAALRLASTRAKGRVLRDALNIGSELFEELGAPPAERQGGASPRATAAGPTPGPRQGQGGGNGRSTGPPPGAPVCTVNPCGLILTQKQLKHCNDSGLPRLCEEHEAEFKATLPPAA